MLHLDSIMIKAFLKITILFLFLQSCNLHKEMVYLQDLGVSDKTSNTGLLLEDYKLQKNDILYINIKSDYQFESNILDLNSNTPANYFNPTSLYLNGYSIDHEGYITIPIIGKIYAEKKTIIEIQKEIEVKANSIIKDAYVSVKLINFNISILGEVQNPGSYNILAGENSLFKVIALSGDLTDYANRKNILLLRRQNDTIISRRIDLTSKVFFTTGDYFLRPNDIIYIEPVKSKGFRILASDYSVALTTITSTITAILLIINLQKIN